MTDLAAELHSLAAVTGNEATEAEHIASLLKASNPALAEQLKSCADRLNAIAQSANKLAVDFPAKDSETLQ